MSTIVHLIYQLMLDAWWQGCNLRADDLTCRIEFSMTNFDTFYALAWAIVLAGAVVSLIVVTKIIRGVFS